MARVIILNGPPGVGKDTIANCLVDHHNFHKMGFKDRLIDIAAAVAGTSRAWLQLMNDDRNTKEEPNPCLFGYSPRQWLIHVSENVIKPTMGSDYFGQAALQNVCILDSKHRGTDSRGVDIVFSDGGFPEEVECLTKSSHSVAIVKLFRDGYTFAGDSRSYLDQGIEYYIPAGESPEESALNILRRLS